MAALNKRLHSCTSVKYTAAWTNESVVIRCVLDSQEILVKPSGHTTHNTKHTTHSFKGNAMYVYAETRVYVYRANLNTSITFSITHTNRTKHKCKILYFFKNPNDRKNTVEM